MLVTDAGRLIRVPGDQVRVTGRISMGVTLFRLDAGEHVTSVFPVLEEIAPDDGAAEPQSGVVPEGIAPETLGPGGIVPDETAGDGERRGDDRAPDGEGDDGEP
jgi:DNA gyrase subunit A